MNYKISPENHLKVSSQYITKLQNMMRVLKRNGDHEDVSFDKVLNRMKYLSHDIKVNIFDIAQKVCSRIYDGVKTSELDELAAHMCSSMLVEHPDYGKLASRIIVSNHHKNTSPSFSETVQILYDNYDVEGTHSPIVSQELYEVVMKNKEKLNSYLDYSRDYHFDYFGFKTLERSYLLRKNGKVIERPQHMWMRVALGIHGNDFKDALETYDLMSKKYFTHATPTLFNAGTPRPQLSSCYLVSMNDDSITGIFSTLEECALISKYAGGIGLHIHNIRAKGSRIRGTNGTSDGIIPMLRVYNNVARYVNQCFTPETMVYTKTGTKRMDQVSTDDELITMDGSFKKVNSVSINNIEKEIMQIRTKYSFEPIKVTKEHEIYAIPGQRRMTNFDVIKKRLCLGIVQPQFKKAQDLKRDDIVGYPIPTFVKDCEEYDTDFCRFYGIMLGDGSIHKRKGSQEQKVHLNMTTKVKTSEFVEEYLKRRNIHYWVTKNTNQNGYAIGWSNSSIIKYEEIYTEVGDIKEKFIHPKFLHLPKDKTLAIVKGLMETDGHFGKELYFCSSSYSLAHSFRYLMLRLGSLTSGYIRNNIGKGHTITRRNGESCYIETKKINYVVRIPKTSVMKELFDIDPQHNGFFVHDSIIWSRINKIETIRYSGNVYDFNMMDNHNYIVSSLGLVHNSGKRNGSIAIYMEPHHSDIESFLELRKNTGNEEERCRDLFYALWIPDLFMKRVKENGKWSLMCPDVSKGLSDCWGEEFEALYEKYEREGKYTKQVNAQDLWFKIMESQIEQGVPYMLFKDAANRKSNQQNLGTIKSSNLCVAGETLILTDKGNIPIIELEGQKVNVWNGKQFSETKIVQTGINQHLLDVKFNNGVSIKCTPYHKFYIEVEGKEVMLEAKDLQTGMRIIEYDLPSCHVKDVIVVAVEDHNEFADTYCFNEPLEHKGVFNGILTGNCTEIVEYSSPDETAICNLSSICLPSYIETSPSGEKHYNYDKLHAITKVVTKNLNKVIDRNFYPHPKTVRSNMRHRPIGIGVQGLADTFAILRHPFDSPEAKEINKRIFETIYHAALETSMEIAKKRHEVIAELKANGRDPFTDTYLNLNEYEKDLVNTEHPGAYTSFEGSPASRGLLQFDLWGKPHGGHYDWDGLKKDIMKYGIRNSLLIAPMPTASTAQIMGFNESFEPFTSNIFKRKVLSGEFVVVNKYLINDLIELGLWNRELKDKIILSEGSIQSISEIPDDLKQIYKTVWEIKQKNVVEMSADRGIYICQSQSLNIFMEDPNFKKLTSMHFYNWELGLKTSSYYLRTRPLAKVQKFTVDAGMEKKAKEDERDKKKQIVCTDEVCLVCGS